MTFCLKYVLFVTIQENDINKRIWRKNILFKENVFDDTRSKIKLLLGNLYTVYTHIQYFALQYFSFIESLSFVVKSVLLLKKTWCHPEIVFHAISVWQ